ncbi:hypothetical protein G9A89_004225 [Geosiphon pyriformis]|nr:hypothetical protein G9A89_004225 [Geosiphon pyriformis]
MSSILAKLQAVALVLECVLSFSAVTVYLDSQAAINVCMERHYIFDLIREKDLSVSWIKVKSYSGVCGNIKANAAAGAVACSQFSLPIGVWEWLLIAESMVVFDNAHHFVRDLFRSVCWAH